MTDVIDEIDIDATAERVWSILADAAGYAKWNPEIKSIEGSFSQGAMLTLHRDSAPEKSTVEVAEFDAPRTLKMRSSGGMPSKLLQAERTFVLSPLSETSVRVSQRLVFTGFMAKLALNGIPDQKPIIESVGRALKRVAER
ncbi:MAG: SRPBCC domain-containing protein [Sphingomonas sp.]